MTSVDLGIREMTESDIPSLLEIEVESFPVPWTLGMFRGQIELADRSENLVIHAGGKIIGYIATWYGYAEMHILSIAVLREERGGGAAGMLLEESLTRGRKTGCMKAVLEVRMSNTRALRFYEKNGFRLIGRRRKYYADSGEDALVLQKDLVSDSG